MGTVEEEEFARGRRRDVNKNPNLYITSLIRFHSSVHTRIGSGDDARQRFGEGFGFSGGVGIALFWCVT